MEEIKRKREGERKRGRGRDREIEEERRRNDRYTKHMRYMYPIDNGCMCIMGEAKNCRCKRKSRIGWWKEEKERKKAAFASGEQEKSMGTTDRERGL